MKIDFEFVNQTNQEVEKYEEMFLSIIKEALKQLNICEEVELSVIFVDDQEIHRINKEYRNIDQATDVISFALEDHQDIHIEGMARSLGDIFISVDKAKSQAIDYGHSIDREYCFLFTHGLLHLCGYDHMDEITEKEMFQLQEEILNAKEIRR